MGEAGLGRRLFWQLLLVNAGWVAGVVGVALMLSPQPAMDSRRDFTLLCVAIVVSMQFLAWLWRRGMFRLVKIWPRRSLKSWLLWWLGSMALGSSCAFLSGCLAIAGGFGGYGQNTLTAMLTTPLEILEFVIFALFAGVVGVVIGFGVGLIPAFSPLVVLSWERVARALTDRADGVKS